MLSVFALRLAAISAKRVSTTTTTTTTTTKYASVIFLYPADYTGLKLKKTGDPTCNQCTVVGCRSHFDENTESVMQDTSFATCHMI